MKRCLPVWMLVVLVSGVVRADDAAVKQIAQSRAEQLNNAVVSDDFATVASLTHPQLVQNMGGREQMIAAMQNGTRELKARGAALQASRTGAVADFIRAGAELYAVVPFELEMRFPGGTARQKSFVIGISADNGQSWVFVNGDVDLPRIKQILPNLPAQLKLPENQKAVVTPGK